MTFETDEPSEDAFSYYAAPEVVELGTTPTGEHLTVEIGAGEDMVNGERREDTILMVFSPTTAPPELHGLPTQYELDPVRATEFAVALYNAMDELSRRRFLNHVRRAALPGQEPPC